VLQVGDSANGNGANLRRRAVLRPANGNAACLEVRRTAVGATDLKPWLHV
jgi:hypothetical protein